MTTTIIHCCMNIEGFLENNKNKPLNWFDGLATKNDGTPATGSEYLAFLQEHLNQGHRVVPVGDECEGFDYQTGCPGHSDKEEQNIEG